MRQVVLRLDFLSYWHAGTGKGAAAMADAVVFRDEAGLPCLPGRTVRGLVRAAMERAAVAGRVDPARVVKWFGTPKAGVESAGEVDSEKKIEAARFSTQAGLLWFGSAHLPESWRRWAATGSPDGRKVTAELTTHIASTAIDSDGKARDETLRVSEVTVPMTLRAVVRGPADDPGWKDDLQAALPLLRSAGTRRHRGYGRVRAVLEEETTS